MRVKIDTTVKRGQDSWLYVYIILGFTLTIEGSVVQMITCLKFPWNLVTYGAVSAVTFWLFLFNGWFQNKLIGFRIKYEDKAR